MFFSGQGLSPGLYGALLAGFESTQGRYPLTLAYLDFVAQLIQVLFSVALHMCHVMRKLDFCLCEIKGADQLRSNCEADQHLCFRYNSCTIHVFSKSKISSHLLCLHS